MPTGCCVAYEPVGWKTPSSSTLPLSAPYVWSASGLAIENAVSESAPTIELDGLVIWIVAVLGSTTSQPTKVLGGRSSDSLWLKPPKTVCQ